MEKILIHLGYNAGSDNSIEACDFTKISKIQNLNVICPPFMMLDN